MATIILRELIPVDPDNILGSYKAKQLVFARNWTLFTTLLLEIDRYISLPIFCPIIKHFTFFTFVIHNYTSSEMCSLHLTHPSTHTPGAVDTHTHTHTHTPGAVDTHTHTHTHTHLEQWTHTHTHTPGAVDTLTHTHTHTPGAVDTHTHTHTHLEQWTHTHTHLEQWTHTHTHTHTPGAVDTVHSGNAPAQPPHVTLYKIHSFETR